MKPDGKRGVGDPLLRRLLAQSVESRDLTTWFGGITEVVHSSIIWRSAARISGALVVVGGVLMKSKLIVIAGAAFTGVALSALPAHAASGEVVITKWVNDVPYSKQCSTSVVSLYNASNAPVKRVRVLWKGSTLNG